ncbi:hypothetical protein AND_009997 [Anopheles darlingi]|uniref:Uncharacterized protein n=1 Tax=Anopheles darlingi TaxID=43151 RepID=W5J6N5_ANODA|nr:hypothetical protein AND_009997 [Anopheles darlingi]
MSDGILSRAEALAAVDIGKHQNNHPQMATQLKHDVMYHHGMGAPPQRPLQGHVDLLLRHYDINAIPPFRLACLRGMDAAVLPTVLPLVAQAVRQ